MSYGNAYSALREYRRGHRRDLVGLSRGRWFAGMFSSLRDMLGAFDSGDENAKIEGTYATGSVNDRIPQHLRLDYVCGMRKEIRKQYVSGEADAYTDVTPFRHGAVSAVGAALFDSAFDQVLNRRAGNADSVS